MLPHQERNLQQAIKQLELGLDIESPEAFLRWLVYAGGGRLSEFLMDVTPEEAKRKEQDYSLAVEIDLTGSDSGGMIALHDKIEAGLSGLRMLQNIQFNAATLGPNLLAISGKTDESNVRSVKATVKREYGIENPGGALQTFLHCVDLINAGETIKDYDAFKTAIKDTHTVLTARFKAEQKSLGMRDDPEKIRLLFSEHDTPELQEKWFKMHETGRDVLYQLISAVAAIGSSIGLRLDVPALDKREDRPLS